jgi:hypothetical protein
MSSTGEKAMRLPSPLSSASVFVSFWFKEIGSLLQLSARRKGAVEVFYQVIVCIFNGFSNQTVKLS